MVKKRGGEAAPRARATIIDATLPNAEGATGPWQQTMAAAAAMELANDGWLTIFSIEEDVNPVDFEVFVLGTLKIVIYVENYPQKRSFRLAYYHPLCAGVLISGYNMYTYHIYTYRGVKQRTSR